MESALREEPAHCVTVGRVRRDEGAQHDRALFEEQPGNLADTADVLLAVGRAEAEVAVQAVAQHVAIQQHRLTAVIEQAALDRTRDRRLA